MIHRRQFILANTDLRPSPTWRTRPVGPWFLSHCSELPIVELRDRCGRQWWLLGVAVQSRADLPSPEVEIAQFAGNDIATVYRNWCGRWLLLNAHTLHLDAGGTLGVYYAPSPDGRGLVVSSSFALLHALVCPNEEPEFSVRHTVGMDWPPAPGSRCASLHRLMPTQMLAFRDDNQRRAGSYSRGLEIGSVKPSESEKVYDEIADYMTTVVRRLGDRFRTIYLPLTGGNDSRVVLAAAVHERLRFTAFTQHIGRSTHGRAISRADAITPRRICRRLGVPYRYIRPNTASEARLAEYDAHTVGHANDLDRGFYALGQWETFAPSSVVLRGGIFEVGRCYFWDRLADIRWDENDVAGQFLRCYGVGPDVPSFAPYHRHLSKWLAWCGEHPIEGLDIKDRFYLDQRVGAWLSGIEQGLDLTETLRIHIANSHRFFSLVLSLPVAVRRHALHHHEVIRRLAPDLARWPVNKKFLLDHAAQFAGRARAKYQRWRSQRATGRRLQSSDVL